LDSRGSFVGNFDGMASFPFDGNSGSFIGFAAVTSDYSLKDNTILVMHELGHTLGMAHSDFLTRRTCPGTPVLDPIIGDLLGLPNATEVCNIARKDPSGNHTISVMQACGFFRWPTVDFTKKDKDAFRILYSQVELPCATADTELLSDTCITNQDTIDYIFDHATNDQIGRFFQLGILCEN